jgi:UDP-glucose 4-epimerase
MRLEYLHKHVSTDEVIYDNFRRLLEFRIGDVRDDRALSDVVREADVVVNAAALKQVPTCEYFPEQALLTNCIGAVNLVRAVRSQGRVSVVVGISTDKACKPVNVMGMTKAIQERLLVSGNIGAEGTRFVGVRYGNVIASRGSVIPLFLEQANHGGPVTVTDPNMTRFLLSLDEAVDVVIGALNHARPGEIFVPICPSAAIINIAKVIADDVGAEIVISGARPGEKVHEVLISEEEVRHTRQVGPFYAIMPMLPELHVPLPEIEPAKSLLGREYTSKSSVVDLEETRVLLKRNGLLPRPSEVPSEIRA